MDKDKSISKQSSQEEQEKSGTTDSARDESSDSDSTDTSTVVPITTMNLGQPSSSGSRGTLESVGDLTFEHDDLLSPEAEKAAASRLKRRTKSQSNKAGEKTDKKLALKKTQSQSFEEPAQKRSLFSPDREQAPGNDSSDEAEMEDLPATPVEERESGQSAAEEKGEASGGNIPSVSDYKKLKESEK